MVAIIIGSTSDYEKVKSCCDVFEEFGIPYKLRALSAHRTGKILEEFIEEFDENIDLYVAAAGKAAHLPGVIAASTVKPVIGIPIKSSTLEGMDALLSIVQMPPGVPVATVAIDGSKNAGLLAIQMLAINNPQLTKKLLSYKKNMEEVVLKAEEELLTKING